MRGKLAWQTPSCSKPRRMWRLGAMTPISAAACSNSASLGKAAASRAGSGHCFFAHGFAKSGKANVSTKELKALKRLADVLIGFSERQLEAAKAAGELIEVQSDGDDKEQD